MIIWRGWGIVVFLLFLLSVGVAAGAIITMAPSWLALVEGGELTIPAFLKIVAVACLLTSASVWPIAQHRSRVAPDVDHLAYIPMNQWPGLLVILAVVSFGASFVVG